MRQKDIADRFISGLNNLSQARMDLKNVVTALMAMYSGAIISSWDGWGYRSDKWEILNLSTSWTLWRKRAQSNDWVLHWGTKPVFSSDGNRYFEPERVQVMGMRQHLHELIDGLLARFPHDPTQVSLILDAADVV